MTKKYRLQSLSVATIIALVGAVPALGADKLDNIEVKGQSDGNYEVKDSSSVGKMNIPLVDTPRSVNVLNGKFIEDTDAQNVRDLFDYVSGMSIQGTGRSFISRGQSVSMNNIMIDGLKTSLDTSGGAGSRFPSVFNAESVDFIAGPTGTLYGAGSGFGAVNINTKKPQKESATNISYGFKSYISADTGYLEQNAFNYNIDSTGAINDEGNVLYRVITQQQPNNKMFQKGRFEDNSFFNALVTFEVDDTLSITPSFIHQKQKRSSGTSYGDGLVAPKEDIKKVDNRSFYYGGPFDYGQEEVKETSLFITKQLGEDWSTKVKITSKNSDSDNDDLYVTDSSNEVYTHTDGKKYVARKYIRASARNRLDALDANLAGRFDIAGIANNFLVGFTYNEQNVASTRNFQETRRADEPDYINLKDHNANNHIEVGNPSNQQIMPNPQLPINYSFSKKKNSNIYLSDSMMIGDSLIINGGVARVSQEKSNISRSKPSNLSYKGLSKNGALIYKLSEDMSVYGSYSYAFQPIFPYSNYTKIDGSTDYKPKETTNLETGFKVSGEDMSLSLSLFKMGVIGDIEYVTIDGTRYRDQKDSEGYISQGAQLSSFISPMAGVSTMFSYAYTDAFYQEDDKDYNKGDRRSNVSKHALSTWNSYQINSDLRLGLGLIYESPKLANNQRSKRTKERDFNPVELDSRFQVDASAHYKLSEITKLSVVVKNLLDEKRMDYGSRYQQMKTSKPRSIAFRVTHSF